MPIEIESSWRKLLFEEFKKPYFWEIKKFLESEIKAGKTIYPQQDNIFAAFNTTPADNVKVVILWQDPYHGAWQAHGLSFSVEEWIKIPSSLRNIYKELSLEYPDYKTPTSGNLTHWSKQWVLMLNSILTVEAERPASHSKIGWSDFTDAVISNISESREWIIFLLWGNYSRSKKVLIDSNKHFILESPHPSPFSAHSWFFGNNHFREVNRILKAQKKEEIIW